MVIVFFGAHKYILLTDRPTDRQTDTKKSTIWWSYTQNKMRNVKNASTKCFLFFVGWNRFWLRHPRFVLRVCVFHLLSLCLCLSAGRMRASASVSVSVFTVCFICCVSRYLSPRPISRKKIRERKELSPHIHTDWNARRSNLCGAFHMNYKLCEWITFFIHKWDGAGQGWTVRERDYGYTGMVMFVVSL